MRCVLLIQKPGSCYMEPPVVLVGGIRSRYYCNLPQLYEIFLSPKISLEMSLRAGGRVLGASSATRVRHVGSEGSMGGRTGAKQPRQGRECKAERSRGPLF